jgi:acyl-CoA dehydrogenase
MLQTGAVKDGDSWVINGHKWFTTNAVVADFLIVMVATDPGNQNPHARASMIIVAVDTPGVNVARNIPTMASEHAPFGYGHSEVF